MKVGIIMGSISDMPVMKEAIEILKQFGIETETDIVSAHRTPEKLFDYSKKCTSAWNFSSYRRSWREQHIYREWSHQCRLCL